MTHPDQQHPFHINIPFRCRNGWPARLLGKLNRPAFPYLVAVFNPTVKAEEYYAYGIDGRHVASPSPLDLVNISDKEYYAAASTDDVTCSVEEMPRYPAGENVFHHDISHMGSPLARGWIAMHEGFGRPDYPDTFRYLDLVNQHTGQRFRVRFAPTSVQTDDEFFRVVTNGRESRIVPANRTMPWLEARYTTAFQGSKAECEAFVAKTGEIIE